MTLLTVDSTPFAAPPLGVNLLHFNHSGATHSFNSATSPFIAFFFSFPHLYFHSLHLSLSLSLALQHSGLNGITVITEGLAMP